MLETIDQSESFADLLARLRAAPSVGSDDVVGLTLPLVEQVAELHGQGLVAPLDGVSSLRASLGQLWFPNAEAARPKDRGDEMARLARVGQGHIVISDRFDLHTDDGAVNVENRSVSAEVAGLERPAYLPGYRAWEQALDHHDPLSDIFVLGLVLGSVATRLDLGDREALAQFVEERRDLSRHYPRIHPVIARIVRRMTELDRKARPQDLGLLARALESYRDQVVEDDDERAALSPGSGPEAARIRLHERLRDRLFELSRRNRLIYFRETRASVNLSVASMPKVIDPTTIRPSQILHFDANAARALNGAVDLGKWLKFEDYGYVSGALDGVRLDARREVREYGFSQLRLVIAFLRWTNLKETPSERIHSPLILAPCALTKRKAVTDSFRLEADLARAEINPALRNFLRKLFDIRLPETIDLTEPGAVAALHSDLSRQLTRSGTGVALSLVDTPRIMLIHRAARRKLDDFLKRTRRSAARGKSYEGLRYSYERGSVEPLGVQIFERDIRVARAPRAELFDRREPSVVSQPPVDDEAAVEIKELEGDFYTVDDGRLAGSHDWEIDLCAMTLANFNYRKMTLVRDYSTLTAGGVAEHDNFDRLFSDEPRASLPPVATAGRFQRLVLPSDPSQTEAVERAASGLSFVIQGPPGTGKSQTIANLIATLVAEGKSVLFVCEKRAALDVVFHRLRQVGLGALASLIHDSQADKKAFIEELETIYAKWTAEPPDEQIVAERDRLQAEISRLLNELERFSSAMTEDDEERGGSPRGLIEERLARGGDPVELSAETRAALPSWGALVAARTTLRELRDELRSAGLGESLAATPFRLLSAAGIARGEIGRQLERILAAIEQAREFESDAATLAGDDALVFADLRRLADACRALAPLAEADALGLLDPDDPKTHRLVKQWDLVDARRRDEETAREKAEGWPDDLAASALAASDLAAPKLAAPQLAEMLGAARYWEGRFFAFVSGGWRRARSFVRASYRGEATGVLEPLGLLRARRDAGEALVAANAAFRADFGFEPDARLREALDRFWRRDDSLAPIERDLAKLCVDRSDAPRTLNRLIRLAASLRRADQECALLFTGHESLSLAEIRTIAEELQPRRDMIGALGDLFARLEAAGADVANAVRHVALPLERLECAVLEAAVDRIFRRDRRLEQFSGERLAALYEKLSTLYKAVRELNGPAAVTACRKEFHAEIARSGESAAGTSGEEKDRRRDFRRGRKALENEFQKTRAYKSIREMFSSEIGAVLRRLKPVWLMSPLSVADILPLDQTTFDVVIFDEASQIPLEDAAPSLYRARQMIVVGDDMQLPPSSFFAAQARDDDADGSGAVAYEAIGDSFLDRASAALPSSLLAWHYRSRNEVLIGFCNAAFYKGSLQTIPDVTELAPSEPIRIVRPEDARRHVEAALDRPLTFHRLVDSPYAAQRNRGEAVYIARLLRELFARAGGQSIGVVAFSQAQQQEIETAVEALAEEDSAFRARLEAEEEREEEGQFVGLFIKNLENVQGDERDIIILSICYGPAANGRMMMNFGPINQDGGEKRLNVVFSRAKRHMIVVSSIDAGHITNVYNDGASALRQYLAYAEAASTGDAARLAAALLGFARRSETKAEDTRWQAAADQLADALTKAGLVAIRNHGQSSLKCHIAVRRPEERRFRLAVIVDDRSHYEIADLTARYVVKASILEAFGWTPMTVLAKDWRSDPKAVVEKIVALCAPTFQDRE